MAMEPVRILTVCTGNICRSPAVERLLAARLGPAVDATSAGTGAVVGHSVAELMAPLVESAGASVDGFEARQITPAMVKAADLILALTVDHRAKAVQLAPAKVLRAFTLMEFARIVGSPDFPEIQAIGVADRLREMITLAAPRRMLGAGVVDDDIPDPIGRSAEVYASSFEMIRNAVDVIVAVARS